ncbi:MAG: DNA-binding response regulator [Candidatus Obscuribacterales bacterium]
MSLIKDLRIVALVDRPDKALESYERLRPDIVILVSKTGTDSVDLVSEICKRQEDARVIMLMERGSPTIMTSALEAGVRGIGLTRTSSRRIRVGIDCILSGEVWFDEGLLKPLITRKAAKVTICDPLEESLDIVLTDRQRSILSLVSQGYSNKKIGTLLFLSHETVKSHLQRVMGRLAASDRTEAVVKAIRLNLI